MKKGFIHLLVPIVAIVVLSLGIFTSVAVKRTDTLNKQRVLSEKSGGSGHGGGGDSGGSRDSGGSSGGSSSSSSGGSSSGGSGGSTENKSTKPSEKPGAFIPFVKPSEKPEVKTEVENKTEAENELPKDLSNVKFNLEKHGTRLVIKFKNEAGKEVEVAKNETEKVENEIKNRLEKEDIKIATGSAGLLLSKNQTTAQTDFPITFDNQTNQLQVTTPQGQKDIAILPDQALKGILGSRINTASEIKLTLENNTLAYKIKGLKDEKLFGLVPVTTAVETTVSAQNGSVIQTQQALIDRLINLFSF